MLTRAHTHAAPLLSIPALSLSDFTWCVRVCACVRGTEVAVCGRVQSTSKDKMKYEKRTQTTTGNAGFSSFCKSVLEFGYCFCFFSVRSINFGAFYCMENIGYAHVDTSGAHARTLALTARMCGLVEVFNDFRWAQNRQICAFPHSHYGASARKSNSDEKYQGVRILHIVLFARMLQFDVVADQSCRTHNRSLSLPFVSLALCASMHCLCLLKWFPWIALREDDGGWMFIWFFRRFLVYASERWKCIQRIIENPNWIMRLHYIHMSLQLYTASHGHVFLRKGCVNEAKRGAFAILFNSARFNFSILISSGRRLRALIDFVFTSNDLLVAPKNVQLFDDLIFYCKLILHRSSMCKNKF